MGIPWRASRPLGNEQKGVAREVRGDVVRVYTPGFLRFPTTVALHVVLGGAWLALARFQFVKLVRARHPGYHRWAGGVARES